MVRGIDKKGISPVIATIVLVSVGILIAVIIAFWFFASFGEQVTKRGVSIDQLCASVSISVSRTGSNVRISNTGSVPVLGVHILDPDGKGTNCFAGDGVLEGSQGTCAYNGNINKAYPILRGDEGQSYICYQKEITL